MHTCARALPVQHTWSIRIENLRVRSEIYLSTLPLFCDWNCEGVFLIQPELVLRRDYTVRWQGISFYTYWAILICPMCIPSSNHSFASFSIQVVKSGSPSNTSNTDLRVILIASVMANQAILWILDSFWPLVVWNCAEPVIYLGIDCSVLTDHPLQLPQRCCGPINNPFRRFTTFCS